MIRRLAIALVILSALSVAAFGQSLLSSITNIFNYILPSIVSDPATEANTAGSLAQLIHIAQEADQIYNTANAMSQMIKYKTGWQYLVPGLYYPSATNTFGSTAGWIAAINSGVGMLGGYKLATITPHNPVPIYNVLSLAGQMNMASNFATVEIADGLAQNTMATTGAARAVFSYEASALSNLQANSQSTDPAYNSEVGVLNMINSGTLNTAQSLQTTNNLLAAIADQQTVTGKAQRDAMVDELNADLAAQQYAPQATNDLWNGNSSAALARVP